MSKRAVFGVTATRKQAEDIVDDLNNVGFSGRDISVLFPDEAKREAAKLDRDTAVDGIDNKAGEGAAIGASAGTAIGGALGLLAGIGALAIPGLGPFIAAGPIMATLGGLGIGAAVGGVAGSLVGMGIPEHHARRYESLIRGGATLIAAHCEDALDIRRATETFMRHGATDIMTSFDNATTTTRPTERAVTSERGTPFRR